MKEEAKQLEMAENTAKTAAGILDTKKAFDVTVLKVSDKTVIADYFVLATGTSSTHVRALADELEFQLKEQLGIEPNHTEGASGNLWTLLDYGCVVVHIFTKQGREFYKLERLWSGEEIKSENGSDAE